MHRTVQWSDTCILQVLSSSMWEQHGTDHPKPATVHSWARICVSIFYRDHARRGRYLREGKTMDPRLCAPDRPAHPEAIHLHLSESTGAANHREKVAKPARPVGETASGLEHTSESGP